MELLPWVLTHSDLSEMNILVDPDSGHLTGVVDWAEATIEPFGLALWGLESVLGCSGPAGYSYYGNNTLHLRTLFRETLLAEIGYALAEETLKAIDDARTLGHLLRYGFIWEIDRRKPIQDPADTTLLDLFLQSKSRSNSYHALETH